MVAEKLAAHTEHRTFYFYVVHQQDNEIRISMYSTIYTFLKRDAKWANSPANAMVMAQHLIDAVIKAVQEQLGNTPVG